jgi:Rieske Fe-S protein
MTDPTTASTPVNRRQFLTAAAAVTAAVSLPILQPQAASAAKTKPVIPTDPVDIGLLSDYGKDGITDKFAKTAASFFVVRHEGKLVATSSICTHRFCPVTVKDDGFFCKCHKSVFTINGEVTDGPAKTSLPRYGIKTDDKGHVIVSPGTEYSEAKWDDPASFVKVEDKK